jgi:hypothetical protein
MQRLVANLLLLILTGATAAPVALSATQHACCARKTHHHCSDEAQLQSISARSCSASHQCCTRFAVQQPVQPITPIEVQSGLASTWLSPAPGSSPHSLDRANDHPGRSPPHQA